MKGQWTRWTGAALGMAVALWAGAAAGQFGGGVAPKAKGRAKMPAQRTGFSRQRDDAVARQIVFESMSFDFSMSLPPGYGLREFFEGQDARIKKACEKLRSMGYSNAEINALYAEYNRQTQDAMQLIDAFFSANRNSSHASAMAQLDADAKMQELRDEAHDRSMARIDRMTPSQYYTTGNLGLLPIGSDPYGVIGRDFNGDVWRVGQNGNCWIWDAGNWYPR